MNLRLRLLRTLYALPRIRGRDRLIGAITDSFVAKDTLLPSGIRMYLDPSEYAQLEVFIYGSTKPLTLALVDRLLQRGDTLVDVGAHMGRHALHAARAVGPTGKVLAIDAQPYNIDRICRNASVNRWTNIVAICAAVGEREGFATLQVQDERDRSRLSLHEKGPNDLDVCFEIYSDSLKIQNTGCHKAGLGFFGMDDSFRLFVSR